MHPTVHVNPKYNTVPQAAAVRERVPGGQVFVCPPTKSPQTDQRWPGAPPPYPGSQPTYGTHNTGATNQGHTQPHPPYPLPNHLPHHTDHTDQPNIQRLPWGLTRWYLHHTERWLHHQAARMETFLLRLITSHRSVICIDKS